MTIPVSSREKEIERESAEIEKRKKKKLMEYFDSIENPSLEILNDLARLDGKKSL